MPPSTTPKQTARSKCKWSHHERHQTQTSAIFDRIGYALGGGARLRTLGAADHTESHHQIYTIFMVYGAEAVLPCDIIHDSPRVRMYEEKEAELDRQDNLDALEE